MKIKKKSIYVLSALAFLCLMPLLFASGGGEAAEAGDESSSYVKFVTTIFGQQEGEPADFFLFLGRFHPLVLHLPIGMVVIAFFMSIYGMWKKREDLYFPYAFVLGFGFVTACVAVIFGSFLAMSGGYNPELIDRHGWGGLVFAILVGIAFLLKVKYIRTGMEKETQRKASVGVLTVALGVMSFVGHDGGSLTHGEEYLFKYAPNWVRSLAGFPPKYPVNPSDDSQPVYHSIIKPFLENHCVECHGSAKMKGGLRLDNIDMIKKGGKNKDTKLIVHGKAEDSLLYQLMVIDDEDEIMPPDGKLEDPKIALIKWWIDSSKDDKDLFERTIGESGIPEELRYINENTKKSSEEAHKGANEEAKAVPTEKVEEKAAEVKKEVAAATGGVDFAKQVAPIFEARCVKCHGDNKQKGEYRLDKAEFVMVAGESEEKPVVVGKPAESYLVKLIKMTEDDDDVMPPKGGTLTPEEIALIEQWITEGAKFPADLQLQDKSKK
ncbi:MAG: c-type cytochrome [Lentisphaeraceae bacterium]|nr:c-type cytochrome [Lentisphaeraceae bacterium]